LGTIPFVESVSGTSLPKQGRHRSGAVDGTDSEVENDSAQSNPPNTSKKRVKLNDSLSSNSDSQASEKTNLKKRRKELCILLPLFLK
jgi:hypothetical protein